MAHQFHFMWFGWDNLNCEECISKFHPNHSPRNSFSKFLCLCQIFISLISFPLDSALLNFIWNINYRKIANISRNLVCDKIVYHSDVFGASPVGAAPTTCSFLTKHLASTNFAMITARRDKTHLSLGIWYVSYNRLDGRFCWWFMISGWVPKSVELY